MRLAGRVIKWSERPFVSQWVHEGRVTVHVADGRTAADLLSWRAQRRHGFTRKDVEAELQRLRQQNGAVGVSSYTVLVSLFCSDNDLDNARYFYEMSKDDWPTALDPCLRLCSAYAARGHTANVVRLLSELRDAGHVLSDGIITVVLRLCAAKQWPILAARTAHGAQQVSPRMVGLLITATGAVHHAEALLHPAFPGPLKWTAFLSLCSVHRDHAAAARCMQALLRSDDAVDDVLQRCLAVFVKCFDTGTSADALSFVSLCVTLCQHLPRCIAVLAPPIIRCCAALRADASVALAREVYARLAAAVAADSAPMQDAAAAMLMLHARRGNLAAADAFMKMCPNTLQVRAAYRQACGLFRRDKARSLRCA